MFSVVIRSNIDKLCSCSSALLCSARAEIRIKTHLDNTLYLRSLWSELSLQSLSSQELQLVY